VPGRGEPFVAGFVHTKLVSVAHTAFSNTLLTAFFASKLLLGQLAGQPALTVALGNKVTGR
jgi:hypothetical protein